MAIQSKARDRVKVNFFIDSDLNKKLTDYLENNDANLSKVARSALSEYIDKKTQKKSPVMKKTGK